MTPAEFVYTVLLRPRPLRVLANRILQTILPEKLSVRGARIALNPEDPLVSGALTLGAYENEEIAFFQKHFQAGMTLVDVGANVGLYTGLALSTPGFSGRILCVEPDAESRRYLERTIALSPQEKPAVQICPCAASDLAGKAPFYRNLENRGDNRLFADSILRESGEVPVETLDALCAGHGIEKVHFLKIDVQGGEGRVLAGARSLLAASPDVILMTEFWPYGLERCGSDPRSYLVELESLGFAIHGPGGELIERPTWDRLIAQTSGRRYINLYGFKGSHVAPR